MNLFTVIDDSAAIIRLKGGVYKQVSVYHKGDQLYVPHGGGYVRLCASLGESIGTSHPNVKVIEINALGADLAGREPRYVAPAKPTMKAVA